LDTRTNLSFKPSKNIGSSLLAQPLSINFAIAILLPQIRPFCPAALLIIGGSLTASCRAQRAATHKLTQKDFVLMETITRT
jgi:hypothetical protein